MKNYQFNSRFFLLVLLSLLPFSFFAESELAQNVMTIWTDREGLPSDTILDVVQDSVGYIWLASYDGLVRFDGDKFSVMSESSDGFDGKSARVLELGEDGSLWIGTNTAGLYRYAKGAFTHYGKEQGLPDLSVRSLAIDSGGRVWVGTANGVSRLEGKSFVSVVPAGTPAFGIANFLIPLHDASVIAGTNLSGLWLISSQGLRPYLETQGMKEWSFSAGMLDRTGQLWLGTSTGQIFRVSQNLIRDRINLEQLSGSSINTFYTDNAGYMWIGTDRGIVSRTGTDFEFFSEQQGLPSNVVSSLWRDREGNLWVGTERGGLVKFSAGKFVNTSREDGLISDAVNAVTEDRYRSVWVGTDEGISYFPSTADPWHTDPVRRSVVDETVNRLKGIRVRQIRLEADGSLWFSTYSDYGLFVLKADGSWSSFTKDTGLPTNRVRFSYRSSRGDVWVGTTAGPVLYSAQLSDEFDPGSPSSYVPTGFSSGSGLPNLFILCTVEDSAGRIWLGTDGGGLSMYDGTSFTTYTTADNLAGNVVFRVLSDDQGRLWICTSEGLSLYQNGVFYRVDSAVGLGGESVFEILQDSGGLLWIITGRKVTLASASELSAAVMKGYVLANIRSYDRLDGLAGQLSANAWSCMNDLGIVHLPTLKGLSTYNPQSVMMNGVAPPVLVEKMLVDSIPLDIGMSDLTVSPDVRRITFYYTALSFVVPQRVRFQYKLEGYDKDWISAGVNREIGYTNLPPGKYRFRVKAENNDGVINETGASIEFRKVPFFYQTVFFYIGIALILVLSGFLVAYLRVRRLNAQAKMLNKLVQERTAELASEKEKSDALLKNILPPPVAEELKNTGKATPMVYEHAAILFADIVGFTPWASGLEPDEIIRELNELFTGFDEIMEKHGCERIKTLGDGYLAVSGISGGGSECISALVRAGVEMLEYLDRRNLDRRNLGRSDIHEVRIGIDTGSVVGGVVGVKKYIFDVFGDSVNMAFRLEALSVPMGLTVSAEVATAIRGSFCLIERPPRIIKGKGMMTPYFVCWKNMVDCLMDDTKARDTVSVCTELLASGKPAECLANIEALDYTTLEPETGYELFRLASKACMMRGDRLNADRYENRSSRYRL